MIKSLHLLIAFAICLPTSYKDHYLIEATILIESQSVVQVHVEMFSPNIAVIISFYLGSMEFVASLGNFA